MDRGRGVDATRGRLWSVRIRAHTGIPRRRAWAYGSCYGKTATLRERSLVVSRLGEGVFVAGWQREALALVERDYEDTRTDGRGRRGCGCF
jgi:hypothetical protein